MKAVYPTLSYTLFIVISLLVLSIILISVTGLIENMEKRYAYNQLNYAAEVVKDEILKIYATNSNGTIQLPLPRDVVGKRYTVEFYQNNLTVKVDVKGETIKADRLVNITATLSGKSYMPASIEM